MTNPTKATTNTLHSKIMNKIQLLLFYILYIHCLQNYCDLIIVVIKDLHHYKIEIRSIENA